MSVPSAPWSEAQQAAQLAGVTVRVLDRSRPDPVDAAAVAELCARIWHVPVEQTPAETSTLIAYAHAGGYVGLAEDDGQHGPVTVVGTAVGFLGRGPADGSEPFLHSHIAGVDRSRIGAGVGLALKLHQRAWCLARGIDGIEWTFDPLIARNAHFNLTRLGAAAVEYLVDFYGPLTDGVNAGLPSDRLLVRWATDAPWPPGDRRPAASGSAAPVTVPVPVDAEALTGEDPARALAWRLEVREALVGRLREGFVITGFDRSVPGYRMDPPA